MKPRISAILFDADGVLQRVTPHLRARLTAALGLGDHQFDAFMQAVFAVEAPALTGEDTFVTGLGPVFEAWGLAHPPQVFFDIWLTIDVDASVLALIGELRRAGIWCALASNQARHRAVHMSDVLGYAGAFDREFYSCDLGHAKPSPAFFTAIVQEAGLDPAATLMIDDRDDNVAGALAAGLHAMQFVLEDVGAGAGPLRERLAAYDLVPRSVAAGSTQARNLAEAAKLRL
jgi:putative hydrolase of the HAD superfamily